MICFFRLMTLGRNTVPSLGVTPKACWICLLYTSMRMLASKLYEQEQARLDSQVTGMRRSQVGTGMRNAVSYTHLPRDSPPPGR